MRPRPINSKRDSRCLGLAVAAMLTATLVAVDPTQAQERPAADVQASAETVVAAVQPIDPTRTLVAKWCLRRLPYLSGKTVNPGSAIPPV
jgi:hypothetical protein